MPEDRPHVGVTTLACICSPLMSLHFFPLYVCGRITYVCAYHPSVNTTRYSPQFFIALRPPTPSTCIIYFYLLLRLSPHKASHLFLQPIGMITTYTWPWIAALSPFLCICRFVVHPNTFVSPALYVVVITTPRTPYTFTCKPFTSTRTCHV